MVTLAYFVHGRGRGHGSRSKPVIATLREAGYRVVVFAGGDALLTLRDDPEVRSVVTVIPGASAIIRTLMQVPSARDRLLCSSARLLITDGEGPSLLAAHSLRMPSIAIGHGLVFRYGEFEGLPKSSLLRESLNVASSSLGATRKIAVHFADVPSRDRSVRIARPDLVDLPAADYVSPRADEGPLSVLCYFRDANGEAAVTGLLQLGARVLLFGGQHFRAPSAGLGDQAGSALTQGSSLESPDGRRSTFVTSLLGAHAVVASAGSNLLSECVALSKPVLALYRASDHEQRLNALLVERANLGMACTIESLSRGFINEFLNRVRLGTFARYPLLTALPPVSRCVEQSVHELLSARGWAERHLAAARSR